MLKCSSAPHSRQLGRISISVDPTSLRGELIAFDASPAPTRRLFVRATPAATETVFVFDHYARDDSTFKGRRVPRTDHLAPGAVVARITQGAGEALLVFDGTFQLPPDFDRGQSTSYRCE